MRERRIGGDGPGLAVTPCTGRADRGPYCIVDGIDWRRGFQLLVVLLLIGLMLLVLIGLLLLLLLLLLDICCE
jgi:hypothetical protein